MSTKMYKRELNKVQEQIDNVQEQFVNGLVSELEKIDAILYILDDYRIKTVAHYKHLVTHDEITGLIKDYNQVWLLDNVRRALLLVDYINKNVNVYIDISTTI